MLLTRLNRYHSLEVLAGIYLQILLIGAYIELYPSGAGSHGKDAQARSLMARVSRPVGDKCVIVAYAISAAIVNILEDVMASFLGGCEVKEGVFDCADNPGWNLDAIGLNVTRCVWHVQGVSQLFL